MAETRGTVIFASVLPKLSVNGSLSEQANTLTLSVASPDPFPWSPCLSETVTTSLNVESPWALTVLPSDSTGTGGIPNDLPVVSSASFNKKGIELPHESSGSPQFEYVPFSSRVFSVFFTRKSGALACADLICYFRILLKFDALFSINKLVLVTFFTTVFKYMFIRSN